MSSEEHHQSRNHSSSQQIQDLQPPLSRRPRRYHRLSISLKRNGQSGSSSEPSAEDESNEVSDYIDHAVEADDEKGPILRSLPAPPLRHRKGLRGHSSPLDLTPAISPLQTPRIEKDTPPTWSEVLIDTKDRTAAKQEDEQLQLYAKYTKRKRAEIVRRMTETFLLALIGFGACRTAFISTQSLKWEPELKIFLLSLGLVYSLFPLRSAWRWYRNGLSAVLALHRAFHIPSRFDPGQLLYPVFLPFFIATCVGYEDTTLVVTNLVLGLSSLPDSVIRLKPRREISYIHWAVSLTPLYTTKLLKLSSRYESLRGTEQMTMPRLDCEQLILLFPLHQTLLRIITYLTTTSLDPSEAHLFSIGLINLLLFASSPQAKILKSLLWLGGSILLLLCNSALCWEVTLARIPSWKFARNKPTKTGIKGRVNRLLNAIVMQPHSRFAMSSAFSDSDSDSPIQNGKPKFPTKPQQRAPERTNSQDRSSSKKTIDASARTTDSFNTLSRSATFSTFGRAAVLAVRWRNRIASSSKFSSLTYAQAQAFRWLIAIYVYLIVALIILGPIKYYIGSQALSSYEPIGWAIGYFIGDIPQARLFVVSNNLNGWIALPRHKSQTELIAGVGVIDHYRLSIIGAANTRLLLAGYCVFVVVCGLAAVQQLKSIVEVDTRRKVFHGVMVAMLVPTIPIDPCFFALALTVVLGLFLMLDVFRASQVPPISRPLTSFLAPFVDGRDHRGPVVVSHIFLLIGCAIPLWLSLAGLSRTGSEPWEGWEVPSRDVSMVSGVICVGMGDAAASLIGRRYGRTKWYWGGGKSIEGSLAFALAVTIGLSISWIWLQVGGWVPAKMSEVGQAVFKALIAGSGASLLESTLTAANDNVVVPIGLWLLVRGLEM